MSPELAAALTHWHAHPDALAGLAVLQAAYLLAVGPLRERYAMAPSADPRQTATFTLGMLVVLVSQVSPLHELAETYLFSAHMVQHVLLTLVAPPLLIAGTPDWLLRVVLRPVGVYRLARLLTHPVMAFGAFSIVFAMWHLPSLYQATLKYNGVHLAEHVLMVATAVMMWWPLTSRMPELPRISEPAQIVYLFLLSVAQIIVFGPLTFSSEPLYQWYADAPRLWLGSALHDQQVGAIIMKVGGGMLFGALILRAFFVWYNREERRSRVEAATRRYMSDAHYQG